jgi:hypothetical protein
MRYRVFCKLKHVCNKHRIRRVMNKAKVYTSATSATFWFGHTINFPRGVYKMNTLAFIGQKDGIFFDVNYD